jgi:hypothetical protein
MGVPVGKLYPLTMGLASALAGVAGVFLGGLFFAYPQAGDLPLLEALIVVIFGGLRSVARFAEWVVPFMALGYLGLAGWVVLTHLGQVPAAFAAAGDQDAPGRLASPGLEAGHGPDDHEAAVLAHARPRHGREGAGDRGCDGIAVEGAAPRPRTHAVRRCDREDLPAKAGRHADHSHRPHERAEEREAHGEQSRAQPQARPLREHPGEVRPAPTPAHPHAAAAPHGAAQWRKHRRRHDDL